LWTQPGNWLPCTVTYTDGDVVVGWIRGLMLALPLVQKWAPKIASTLGEWAPKAKVAWKRMAMLAGNGASNWAPKLAPKLTPKVA
jgi:hypothetical protein